MNADGTDVRKFPQGHAGDWQLSWSPDGKSLCFVLQPSGTLLRLADQIVLN